MAGIYVYLRGGRRGWLWSGALLFVVGGNIKHSRSNSPCGTSGSALHLAAQGTALCRFGGLMPRSRYL